jgi:hypothetical protein
MSTNITDTDIEPEQKVYPKPDGYIEPTLFYEEGRILVAGGERSVKMIKEEGKRISIPENSRIEQNQSESVDYGDDFEYDDDDDDDGLW